MGANINVMAAQHEAVEVRRFEIGQAAYCCMFWLLEERNFAGNMLMSRLARHMLASPVSVSGNALGNMCSCWALLTSIPCLLCIQASQACGSSIKGLAISCLCRTSQRWFWTELSFNWSLQTEELCKHVSVATKQ